MRNLKLTKLVGGTALGLVAMFGTSISTNAQSTRNEQKQVQKITKAQQKIADQRAKEDQAKLRLQQQQEQQRQQNGNRNNNNNNAGRHYRVVRAGRTYTTDDRGAELLRQAVNEGYRQGFNAGQSDHSSRRRSNYQGNSTYRTGTYGYQSYVEKSQYQYYFQQGFQKGYDDGFNSRNRYGSNDGGSLNILGNILSSILNIQAN
jgi:flagellar biosynthesis/type III secretory pathway protein FliH